MNWTPPPGALDDVILTLSERAGLTSDEFAVMWAAGEAIVRVETWEPAPGVNRRGFANKYPHPIASDIIADFLGIQRPSLDSPCAPAGAAYFRACTLEGLACRVADLLRGGTLDAVNKARKEGRALAA
jgi:hypothetical protein